MRRKVLLDLKQIKMMYCTKCIEFARNEDGWVGDYELADIDTACVIVNGESLCHDCHEGL